MEEMDNEIEKESGGPVPTIIIIKPRHKDKKFRVRECHHFELRVAPSAWQYSCTLARQLSGWDDWLNSSGRGWIANWEVLSDWFLPTDFATGELLDPRSASVPNIRATRHSGQLAGRDAASLQRVAWLLMSTKTSSWLQLLLNEWAKLISTLSRTSIRLINGRLLVRVELAPKNVSFLSLILSKFFSAVTMRPSSPASTGDTCPELVALTPSVNSTHDSVCIAIY